MNLLNLVIKTNNFLTNNLMSISHALIVLHYMIFLFILFTLFTFFFFQPLENFLLFYIIQIKDNFFVNHSNKITFCVTLFITFALVFLISAILASTIILLYKRLFKTPLQYATSMIKNVHQKINNKQIKQYIKNEETILSSKITTSKKIKKNRL